MFQQLPPVPDHVALEDEMLAWWEDERVFDELRERNRGGPIWSFTDGPITANNPMGVHHAWGRTLKDVFQRYKALRGHDLRYQSGFDCQGLWVEVGVEQSLGLNSKREIEEYGLAEFAARCKERVANYAEVITEQDRRLGRWMDWDNDYYTFSDTNIEYIWRFLKVCHERGWIFRGHRSTEWCPRCGTSISQHELFAGEYKELDHPSLWVRFPLKGRDGEALVVWTTTPWTLPANVAAAVNPDADYVLTEAGEWYAAGLAPEGVAVTRTVRGSELVGLEYDGPFDHLAPQAELVHRVIPWDAVALDEGTGIVHIAPGAGSEDFELSRVHDLPVLAPIDESGRMNPEYEPFAGLSTLEVERPVIDDLYGRGLIVKSARIVHRYPTCWRCGTPLVFRVVDDWFISAEEIRQPMLEANATVDWTPAHYGKRMDDWLRNMGDWNISRKRYFGLPLPFYPCGCGHLNVIGSRAELAERATAGLEQLQELHRPWIDEVPVRCESCGDEVRRVAEVGDAWLDAGIVPFSTLGWENPEPVPHGYATGASEGLSGADLPDHAYWEQWFPAAWVSEMREQIRLWFYSQCFMAVTLVGRSPYRQVLTYEKLQDETGREMHRSWGNAIEVDEALRTMGADVMRWMFSEANPGQNIRFGYGPAGEIKRRLLTLWNSVKFLVDYANVEGWSQDGTSPGDLQPLDRWLLARTDALVVEATAAYERFWTPDVTRAVESFVDDLSNWYIRRSRRRFWSGDRAALATLHHALVHAVRVISPVMPFLAEHLWRTLRRDDDPRSVFLLPWPEPAGEVGDGLVAEIDEVRLVVELGRKARAESGLKLRQPLRRLIVQGASAAPRHEDEIRDELRVKEVEFRDIEGAFRVTYKPNLPGLGKKGLGTAIPAIRAACAAGDVQELPDGRVRVGEHELDLEDVLVEHTSEPGWQVAQENGLVVALDLTLDPELEREGRVYDLVHLVNTLRKEAGLELSDRIRLTVPRRFEELRDYEERIKDETLALEVVYGDLDEPGVAKL